MSQEVGKRMKITTKVLSIIVFLLWVVVIFTHHVRPDPIGVFSILFGGLCGVIIYEGK